MVRMGARRGAASAASAAAHASAANRAAEGTRLVEAAKKVRVGVRLGGARKEEDDPISRKAPRRRKARQPRPELELELESAGDDGTDQLSPLQRDSSPRSGSTLHDTLASTKLKAGLKSASAFYDATPRGSAADGGSDGIDTAQEDEDDAVLGEELTFSERSLPAQDFELVGCVVYVIFLLLYTVLVQQGRGRSTYQFAQTARDTGAVGEFMQIDSLVDYRDWLEVGFFPGLRAASYAASPQAGIILVGPPRLRQIVGDDNCTISDEMAGMPMACFKDTDSGASSDWPQPPDSPFKFKWSSAAETGEGTYSSTAGYSYDGGGFLLNGTGRLVQRVPDIARPASELFPFSHLRISVEDLFYSGWMSDRTRAIIHDYTLYSAHKDAYVAVRLVLEYGPEHGGFICSKHVRIFVLNEWPDFVVMLEMTFYSILFMLIARDVRELLQLVSEAQQQLKDHIVRLRFQLRLHILQHAAFASMFQYRPRVLMGQIALRLNDSKLRDDRRFHIEQLNAIGKQIPELHNKFRRYLHSEGNRPPSSTDQALAVLDVLDVIQTLDRHQQEVDTLSNSEAWLIIKLYIKFMAALRVYMTNGWRVLDLMNYAIFLFTCFARFTLNDLMATSEAQVLDLPRPQTDLDTGLEITPWDDDSKFVRFYGIAYWTTNITYAFAFNAVLTWIKIFKFLNYYPNMQILTKTLGVAAKPLAWFCLIILIVLIGAGQGFFLAFGLDLKGYRSFVDSVLALLRMAVGDFEYEELEESHRHLGPLMFWIYIFLMFFVLMSVFIALIAESYEEAKVILAAENDELKKLAPEIITDKVLRHSIRSEALSKFNAAVDCRLLSPPLAQHLAEVASGWQKVDSRSQGGLGSLQTAFMRCVGSGKVSPAADGEDNSSGALFHLRRKTRDDDDVNHQHALDVFTSDEEDDAYDESSDLVGGPSGATDGSGGGDGGGGGGNGGSGAAIAVRQGITSNTPIDPTSVAARRFSHRQHELEQLEAEAAEEKAVAIRGELAPLEKRLERMELQISQDRRNMQRQFDRMQETTDLMYKLLSNPAAAASARPGRTVAVPPREHRRDRAPEVRANQADIAGPEMEADGGDAGAVISPGAAMGNTSSPAAAAAATANGLVPSEEEIRHAETAMRADAYMTVQRNSLGHVSHVNDVMAFTSAVLNKRGAAAGAGGGGTTRKL